MSHFDTPEQAAQFFAVKPLSQGYVFKCLHPYVDTYGHIIFWRIRCKHPNGEKWIRSMHKDETGKYHLCEPPHLKDKLKPLYGLPLLAQNPNAIIWLPEGENCVDVFNQYFNNHNLKHQHIAITSGGATSDDKADWQPLAGRTVILWGDNDKSGEKYVKHVKKILEPIGCAIQIVNISVLNLPEKGDVVDWLALNPTVRVDDIIALPMTDQFSPEIAEDSNCEPDANNEKQSQASMLVAFVDTETELFHDKNGDVYAQYKSTRETRRIDGRQFKNWLVSCFYKQTGKSARDQSIREAISTLSGLARERGSCHEVSVRVGMYDDIYYLDLGEPGLNRAVKISAGDWEIIDNPPIYFLRPETMRALPEPISGSNISLLWQLVNIPENARYLVIAWLAECLRPDTPFPILELFGEQGSAKSTTQTLLRKLIDPNASILRAAPKTPEDVFICAAVNWITSYENVSHLSHAMQDALCMLSTGAGFAKRKLYSDADESVIEAKRPIILNGISVAVTAQDLVDRTLSIETPTIKERTETTKLQKNFDLISGKILGGLLDIVAQALYILPSIKLPPEEQPRLLEFVYFGMAIARVMGGTENDFLSQFNFAREESIARTIDASPVASVMIEWCETFSYTREMTVKDLYQTLEQNKPNHSDSWPRSPKGLADALRRLAPALRILGIECRSLGKRGSHVYWEIKPRR
jgi:hypothetical protein